MLSPALKIFPPFCHQGIPMHKLFLLFLTYLTLSAASPNANAAGICDTTRMSPRTGAPVDLTFYNDSGIEAQVYWVDSAGTQNPIFTLQPGESRTRGTHTNHYWVARGVGNDYCLGYFQATQSGTVTLRRTHGMGSDYNYQINGVPFETQTQSNWCWAATAVAVVNHYSQTGNNQQCGIINWFGDVGSTDCCLSHNASTSTCNRPGVAQGVYQTLNMLDRTVLFRSGDDVEGEISGPLRSGRPAILHIRWYGQDVGHVGVIYGIRRSGADLYHSVFDPGQNVGHKVVKNGQLYNTNGEWYATILTVRPPRN
jgi:hypothetical protein